MNAIAIIPAHNEAPRIAQVISPLLASRRFARVLVVDDGSTDDTAQAATNAGAEVLRLSPNRGKGQAILAGVQASREPVVAFFDADLVGLKPEHAAGLVDPVLDSCAGMVCGLRDYGPVYNRLQQAIPPITGERAVRRDVLKAVSTGFWNGFRVEAGINEAACRSGRPIWTTILEGLKIVPKWQKVGTQRGFLDAAKMSREVLIAMRDARVQPAAGVRPLRPSAGVRGIRQAGQATAAPSVDPTGRIIGVDGMLDQIAEALAKQARPILVEDVLPAIRNDRELQRQVGYGAGQALARPLWFVGGALAVLAGVAVYRAVRA